MSTTALTDQTGANVAGSPLSPLVAAAREQFHQDFDDLKAHREQHPAEKWVAYHGRTRIGFGASKPALVQRCVERGLAMGEFLVLGIDPATADPNA